MFNNNTLYQEDIAHIASFPIDWDRFQDKSILITGATGLIGTMLIDALMRRNGDAKTNITLYAVGRNREKAAARLGDYSKDKNFVFIEHDVCTPLKLDEKIDFIIHGASNTHPVAYAAEPINTILLSVLGTKNVLDFAAAHQVRRTVFLSTVEIYGENTGDGKFSEAQAGYIDCNTLRAGYPEGKRVGEALCQAYMSEKGNDVVIARCSRVYGPTMQRDDSKAVAQFLRKAVNNEDIILKSEGNQRYSYCYAADICTALLFLTLQGQKGEAYNIAGNDVLPLRDMAGILARHNQKEVVFDIPSAIESAGYSKATKAILDCTKLNTLGWQARYALRDGLIRTVEILRGDHGL